MLSELSNILDKPQITVSHILYHLHPFSSITPARVLLIHERKKCDILTNPCIKTIMQIVSIFYPHCFQAILLGLLRTEKKKSKAANRNDQEGIAWFLQSLFLFALLLYFVRYHILIYASDISIGNFGTHFASMWNRAWGLNCKGAWGAHIF